MIEGESSLTSQPFLDPQVLVSSLASKSTILGATDMDTPTLVRRLAGRWTVETALKECEFTVRFPLLYVISYPPSCRAVYFGTRNSHR